jgi:hypothetical protein
MELENKNKNKNEYIAEGSFGCVFSSKVQCKDNKDENLVIGNNNQYVSKVSVSQPDDKEVLIGKVIIQNIKHYDYYYAPILNSCPIDIGVIENEQIQKCKLVSNNIKDIYISSTLKYIGKRNIYDYLDDNINTDDNTFLKIVIESHLHLVNALEKLLLIEDPIVHYDLKNGNVMFDESYNVPIIIDFGLSYTHSQLFTSPMNIQSLSNIFYVYYEKYTPWNIEIVILSFIVQSIAIKDNININRQILKPYFTKLLQVVDDYVENFEVLENDEERKSFSTSSKDFLYQFQNKPISAVIDALRNNWKSWDNFSIAMMYYTYLYNCKEKEKLYNNHFFLSYSKMLKDILLSTPKNIRQLPNNTRNNIISFTRI